MSQDFSATFIQKREIQFTIDGKPVSLELTGSEAPTIFEAAQKCGVSIPTLCHQQNEKPVGVCRVCVVDVAGQRVFPASCVRPLEEGMKIQTASDGVKAARKTLLELLMTDHPSPCARQKLSSDCELERLAK
jgi:NADP-reducing hydrogenase subunit HndD